MQAENGQISSAVSKARRPFATYHYADIVLRSDVDLPELPLAGIGDPPPKFGRVDLECDVYHPGWLCEFDISKESCGLEVGRTADRKFHHFKFGFVEVLVELGDPTRLRYRPREADWERATFRHLLLDQVVPRVLAASGQTVLHGALLTRGSTGIALLGPSGAGKSTLAAALRQFGWQLMSDDGIVIQHSYGSVRAWPTYPSLRLWPDSVASLFKTAPVTSPMVNNSAKRRIEFDPVSVDKAVRLAAVFCLEPSSDAIVLTSLRSPAVSCMSLVANGFSLDIADPEFAAERLRRAVQLAGCVDVYSLRYQRRFDDFDRVCSAIEKATSSRAVQ